MIKALIASKILLDNSPETACPSANEKDERLDTTSLSIVIKEFRLF
jgi:hypothetical protein